MDFSEFEKEMKIRGFTKKTIKSYLFYNKKLIDYLKKSPREVSSRDIKDFLSYLIKERNAKPRTVNLAICSLKFYYNTFSNKNLFSRSKDQKKKNTYTIS